MILQLYLVYMCVLALECVAMIDTGHSKLKVLSLSGMMVTFENNNVVNEMYLFLLFDCKPYKWQKKYDYSSPERKQRIRLWLYWYRCNGMSLIYMIPHVFNQVQERVMVTGVGTRRRRMSWTMAWCLSLPNSASHATSKTLKVVLPVFSNVTQVCPTFFVILGYDLSCFVMACLYAFPMSTIVYAPWFLPLLKL